MSSAHGYNEPCTDSHATPLTPTPIGVFWDIENCSVPRGKSALGLVHRIREWFFSSRREVEFMCACDTSKENRDVIQELNYAQVTVVHINATSKNAADDKLRQSLRRFANAYPAPATAVLISGDVNFASDLSDLRYRHHIHVILVHPQMIQEALLACANECHPFDKLTANIPDRLSPKVSDTPVDVRVGGLPTWKPVRVVSQRLKLLSDNCGGRVVTVTGDTAVIKFPNMDAATRAKKRMTGEEVFGTVIDVSFVEPSKNLSFSASPIKRSQHSASPDRKVDVQLGEKEGQDQAKSYQLIENFERLCNNNNYTKLKTKVGQNKPYDTMGVSNCKDLTTSKIQRKRDNPQMASSGTNKSFMPPSSAFTKTKPENSVIASLKKTDKDHAEFDPNSQNAAGNTISKKETSKKSGKGKKKKVPTATLR